MHCNDFTRESAGMPLLSSKSCDGTPVNVKQRTRHTLPTGLKVLGYGRAGHEFLVKMQFLRSLSVTGTAKTAVLMEEATSLKYGKAVPAIAGASMKGWVSVRHVGHLGASIEHYAWDRFGIQGLERFARQWHQHQSSSPHVQELAQRAAKQGASGLDRFCGIGAEGKHQGNMFRELRNVFKIAARGT